MWVPSLICVSSHMPLWQYRTAPVANGVDARRLKTNPSHTRAHTHTHESRGKDREGRNGRRWGEEKKNNSGSVAHGFKRLFITAVFCQTPCLYIHRGIQTHAKLIYGPGRGEMAHHGVAQTDCRQLETPFAFSWQTVDSIKPIRDSHQNDLYSFVCCKTQFIACVFFCFNH